jgi:hypothetical protein
MENFMVIVHEEDVLSRVLGLDYFEQILVQTL